MLRAARRRSVSTGWQAVRRVADVHESRFARIVLEAARLGQAAVEERDIVTALNLGVLSRAEAALSVAGAVMLASLAERMPRELEDTLFAAGQAVARETRREGSMRAARRGPFKPIGGLNFDLTNPAAIRWIKQHAGELITRISEQNRRAIRRIIERSFLEGIPTDQAARLIRALIGLTPRDVDAIYDLYHAIMRNPGRKIWAGRMAIRVPRGGATAEWAGRRAAQYANRLLNWRARLIARTETTRASNEGQLQLWRQAVQYNMLDYDAVKMWIATPDERTCAICQDLDQEEQLMNDEFSHGIMTPPAHPACRCSMGLVRSPKIVDIVTQPPYPQEVAP